MEVIQVVCTLNRHLGRKSCQLGCRGLPCDRSVTSQLQVTVILVDAVLHVLIHQIGRYVNVAIPRPETSPSLVYHDHHVGDPSYRVGRGPDVHSLYAS